MLALLGIWNAIGLVLWVLPSALVLAWVRTVDANAAVGAFLIVLLATGVVTLKWKAMSRVLTVFHRGSSAIVAGMTKTIAEFDN